jgi:hypothetical protein
MPAPLHILGEHRITLDEAREPLGTSGKPADYSTVFRAVTDGTLVNGERIPLEALKSGGKWVTSREAVDRYLPKLTEAALDRSKQPRCAPTDSSRRKDEINRAARECEALAV